MTEQRRGIQKVLVYLKEKGRSFILVEVRTDGTIRVTKKGRERHGPPRPKQGADSE